MRYYMYMYNNYTCACTCRCCFTMVHVHVFVHCTLFVLFSFSYLFSLLLVMSGCQVISVAGGVIKVNVAVYKDLNIEFVSKESFCHENAV